MPIQRKIITREELHGMYWSQRKSIRQIAELHGATYGAILYLMTKYGIPTRNKPKPVLKYARTPFSGDENEKAYLLGLRAGDIHARKRATNTVGINVTTTRPAMLRLCEKVFGKYGYVKKYPVKGPVVYEWYVYCDLDKSFEFLIEKPSQVPDDESFYAFLAGYVDSEGTWTFDKQVNKLMFSFWIKSQDLGLLNQIKEKLKSDGFHPSGPKLQIKEGSWQKASINGKAVWVKNRKDFWCLRLNRQDEIILLAEKLTPFVHHEEKIKRMSLISNAGDREWSKYGEEARSLIKQMNEEAKEWVKEAEQLIKARRVAKSSEIVDIQQSELKTCAPLLDDGYYCRSKMG